MSEVHFEVDVAKIDETYGVTIVVSDSGATDASEVPHYFLVFSGPKGGMDRETVAQIFGQCHQDAMDSVGLEGTIDEDKFESLLEDSVELAGELMIKHGFVVLDVTSIDEGLLKALIESAALGEVSDPQLLN